ncbi:rhodanese-like domain-containing protein [Breoghania sp. L-A4]|nr:rhodanese-like domain-containing protein [Breoghania sp. L-A4]
MTRVALLALLAGMACATSPVLAEEGLKMIGDMRSLTVQTEEGPVEITRTRNDVMLIGGVLQPIVPVPGVVPVGEVEVLEALTDDSFRVVDMRTVEWRVKSTIPGSMHIPYTEVAQRLDELGCAKEGETWDCADALKVVAFCNGPACPQSPQAIKAMVREGFPPQKIYYYRGGMQDWTVLGLTTVENLF